MNHSFRIRPLPIFILIHLGGWTLSTAGAKESPPPKTEPKPERTAEKVVLCDDAKMQKVKIGYGRHTTLNFPGTPKEIIPGEAVFDFKRIRNDLAIVAQKPNARTSITVYLHEKRCAFDLVTVSSGGDDILFVRDPKEKQFEVKIQ